VTLESTEETYIGGLTQASLKEVMRDTHRPGRKSGELLLPPVLGECTKGRLRVKDEACVYCLERALNDISFALCPDDP
jgi:hypothetical protein